MSRFFLSGGQTIEKNCQWKKSRSILFILDNRKCSPFHLKYDNVKKWVEEIIVTFLYAVATVDVLMANSNDINLAKNSWLKIIIMLMVLSVDLIYYYNT